MAYMKWPDQGNVDYRSQGVHKNRDNTSKMSVEAKNRLGQTDTQLAEQQAAREAAAAATVSESTEKDLENRPKTRVGVDEPVVRSKKDVSQEVGKAGHKAEAAFGASVTPGSYEIISGPGSGRDSGWGREGTQQNPAQDTSMQEQGIGGMMGGMMGGMGGGQGGGDQSGNADVYAAANSGGGGGGGMGGGEGGGGMMSGLPAQIGKDIASKDDSIDRANNTLFEDDTDIEAMEQLGESLQGR